MFHIERILVILDLGALSCVKVKISPLSSTRNAISIDNWKGQRDDDVMS